MVLPLTRPIVLTLVALSLVLLVACGTAAEAPASGGEEGVVIAPAEATPTAEAAQSQPDVPDVAVDAPTDGRWIDVDVTRFVVRLMEGDSVLETIGPVAVGLEIDTGNFESTQTGLFHVYNKIEDLAYDAPYDTYISHWVGFDPEKANGFHSFLKDDFGAVVDASTGRISNGCIRTGASESIFAFAEIGMPVLVHM
jgi:hypothetical protein